jgi:hypothetical protein
MDSKHTNTTSSSADRILYSGMYIAAEPTVRASQQVEIVFHFFTGSMDVSEKYCDDYKVIAVKYLSSLGGFWFDFATSLPWAFNDLYAYQVS